MTRTHEEVKKEVEKEEKKYEDRDRRIPAEADTSGVFVSNVSCKEEISQ